MKRRVSAVNTPLILAFALFFMALVAVGVWVSNNAGGGLTAEGTAPDGLNQKRGSSTERQPYNTPVKPDPLDPQEDARLWKAFQEAFPVERVDHSGDPKWQERALVRRNFSRVDRLVKGLRRQGLQGDDLFDAVEKRLLEMYGPDAANLVESYRLLEQEMAGADLDAMTPEERFETIQRLRRYAFGDEVAEMVFFERESYDKHKMTEKTILADTNLTAEEKQEQIRAHRKELRVTLASQGTAIAFGDERIEDIDRDLLERYGEEVVEAMTADERRDAVWEMYREELPPEFVEMAERVFSRRAERKAAASEHRREGEAVEND